LSSAERAWVGAQSWTAKQGTVLLLPNGQGGVGGILLGTGGKDWATQSPLLLGVLPAALPPGDYRFASPLPDPELAAVAFLAGSYRFTRYKTANGPKPKRLVLPEDANREEVLLSLKRFISAATSSTRRQTISALQSLKPLHASLPTPLAAASKSRKARGSCLTISR